MEDIGGGDVGQNLKKEGRQYGEVRRGGGGEGGGWGGRGGSA